MPTPLALAAIGIGSQVGSSLLSGLQQQKFDNLAEQRNLRYYNMQRQDALSDWRMQNEYNSPSEQMRRLKEAGISPYQNSTVVGGNVNQTGVRQSNMNVPSAYQVNTAQNVLSNLNILEQIKNLRAQRQKTEAETDGIQQYNDVYAETGRSIAIGQIWTAQAQEEYTKASTAEKKQMLDNMKAQLSSVLEDVYIKKIRNKYEEPFLQGKQNLQNVETENVRARTQEIYAQIKHMKTMTPFEIKRIEQDIQRLRNANEAGAMENTMLPDYLYERNRRMKQENDNMPSEFESEFGRWFDKADRIFDKFNRFGRNSKGFDETYEEYKDENGNKSTHRRRKQH